MTHEGLHGGFCVMNRRRGTCIEGCATRPFLKGVRS